MNSYHSPPLSRFTPSLMPGDLLDRLFVARQQVLDDILTRVRAAATSAERNHTLLVGARGAGKTHLVSLVAHRLKHPADDDGPVPQLAWLPEDPWTIVSYQHLLKAIAERLEPPVAGQTPSGAEELEAILAQRAAAGGPIVVIVENLDQILLALEDEGQQRLRHLLQSDRSLLLVATATRLDRSLSDQASPFYGFFTTTRLEPFEVPEAAAMLTAIAEERGDSRLVSYLAEPQAERRLRTVAHLAGGQPRLWALLASALTTETLDELVELLLTQFDDLTPYYQEQLGRLSGHQRLAVAELAELDRPVNVSELAERLGIEQRSLAKTMGELVERGWAIPTRSPAVKLLDGRRTYYELAEPLARLSFQIKESRGEPLRLIVEFVKLWFDPSELRAAPGSGTELYLKQAIEGQETDSVVCVARHLQQLPITRAPAAALLGEVDDALRDLGEDEAEAFLRLPSPIRVSLEERLDNHDIVAVRIDVHRAALSEFGNVPHPAMTEWIQRTETLAATAPPDWHPVALVLLADWLSRAWRIAEASETLRSVEGRLGAEHAATLAVKNNLASARWVMGDHRAARTLQEEVLEARVRLLGAEHPDTLITKNNLASTLRAMREHQAARTLEEETLEASSRLLGAEHPSTLTVKNNLAYTLWAMGEQEAARTLEEEVLEARVRLLGAEHPDTLTTKNNLASTLSTMGEDQAARTLEEEVLEARVRLLGAEHPSTLTTKNNLASTLSTMGEHQAARTLQQEVLEARMRLLGAEHPDTLITKNNLANTLWAMGEHQAARTLQQEVLEARVRLLGAEHPDTLAIKNDLAYATREIDSSDSR